MQRPMILVIVLLLVSPAGCVTPGIPSDQPKLVSTFQPTTLAPTKTILSPTDTLAATPTVAAISGPWKLLHQVDVHFNANIAGFVDDNHGIVVGDGGVVHYTLDGGKTWPEAQNSSLCRYALDILDENIALHCGNSGSLGLSTDGGKTWQKIGEFGGMEPDQCLHVSFLDPNTGWSATATDLGATMDGGKTWNKLTLPKGLRRSIMGIFLRTANDGYLVDSKGTLWITGDGGKSWSSRALDLKENESFLSSAPNTAVHFYDAQRGMLVAILMNKGQKSVVALHTRDGGQSWQREQIPGLNWAAFFLAPDGVTLTATVTDMQITVWRYQN